MNNPDQNTIKSWYNDYVVKQQKTGINLRHRTIIKKAIANGLNENSKVLEIGCGVGTLTKLICDIVKNGSVTAVDISDESIKKAKENLKNFTNLTLVVNDMSEFSENQKFDFFILPDVLEHIPLDQHNNLFKVLSNHSNENSKILINLPHPTSIAWHHKNKPELMQIIDQEIHSDKLCKNAYEHSWILESLNSYALYHQNYDYQFIVFKKNKPYTSMASKAKLVLKKEDLKSRFL